MYLVSNMEGINIAYGFESYAYMLDCFQEIVACMNKANSFSESRMLTHMDVWGQQIKIIWITARKWYTNLNLRELLK